ncbi:hypothetical protein RIF29_41547 [Crotalaria pallida]|uniref:DUF7026 domain-containing protein n=1 Tax=Crotalaria pallida TaxID=3830 RepID=A0AAN9HST3_CROPI
MKVSCEHHEDAEKVLLFIGTSKIKSCYTLMYNIALGDYTIFIYTENDFIFDGVPLLLVIDVLYIILSTRFSNTSPIIKYLSTHNHKPQTRISCTNKNNNNNIRDDTAALASEFSARVTRMNSHLMQAEDAMRKSRELLFREFSDYMGLKEDEARNKWSNLDEEERWGLVKGFVEEWGQHFQPLSVKSTKEMVEEYLRQGKLNPPPKFPPPPPPSSSSVPLPGLDGIIGF